MGHFLSRLKRKKHEWMDLEEEFPSQAHKAQPDYSSSLQGSEIQKKSIHRLLEDFATEKQPLMYLHVPGESYEEFREYTVQAVKKDAVHVLNISTDTACEDFLRNYAPVRFSFRFQHYLFFFATNALGRIGAESPDYLLEMPEIIYQERRSHQRYRLWPDYEVTINSMPVADISQKGLSFFSNQSFTKDNRLENATLSMPPVYCSSEEECYFEGGEITIPQAVIANCIQEKGGYRYGGFFTAEWPSQAVKTLNDFLLALRKKSREEST